MDCCLEQFRRRARVVASCQHADQRLPACPACRAVHFTSAKLQESAGLIGKEAPHVYTVSKDGALHAWTYRKPDAAAEAAAAAEQEAEEAAEGRKRRRTDGEDEEGGSSEDEGGSGSSSEEDEEGGSSSSGEDEASSEEEDQQQQGQRQQAAAQPPAAPEQSRTFAGGHWKLTEKHYFNQRGAKLSAAAFQVGGVARPADGGCCGSGEATCCPG